MFQPTLMSYKKSNPTVRSLTKYSSPFMMDPSYKQVLLQVTPQKTRRLGHQSLGPPTQCNARPTSVVPTPQIPAYPNAPSSSTPSIVPHACTNVSMTTSAVNKVVREISVFCRTEYQPHALYLTWLASVAVAGSNSIAVIRGAGDAVDGAKMNS